METVTIVIYWSLIVANLVLAGWQLYKSNQFKKVCEGHNKFIKDMMAAPQPTDPRHAALKFLSQHIEHYQELQKTPLLSKYGSTASTMNMWLAQVMDVRAKYVVFLSQFEGLANVASVGLEHPPTKEEILKLLEAGRQYITGEKPHLIL